MQMSTAPGLVVNVRELLRSPGSHREVHVRGPLDGANTPVATLADDGLVAVDGRIESVVDGLLVTADVSATLRLACVRCLASFTEPVRVPVQELFARTAADAEEEGYAVLPGELLLLDTMARDALVLNLPAAPLHDEDCLGLCPVCGFDRNTDPGHHHDEAADPRWGPLAALRTLAGPDDPTTDRSRKDDPDARSEA